MKRGAPRESESDKRISAEILSWADDSVSSTRIPAQGRLLGFRNQLLERAYLRSELQRGRTYFAVSASIVCLLVTSFLWLDQWLLPPELRDVVRTARIYVLIPTSILFVANVLLIHDPVTRIRNSAALAVIFGIEHTVLVILRGPPLFKYEEIGIMEGILGVALIFGLPVRWSAAIILFFGVTFGAATLYVQQSSGPFIDFCADFAVYASLALAATYRHEFVSRREFVAQAQSRKEYAERVAAEADRRRWLEVIASFLRHELRNSMTAISTSIEMANRAAPNADARKYLDRGQRSVQYMHLLLSKVTDATNLEAALAQNNVETLDLSNLILNRVEEFRADAPDRVFTTNIEANVQILGQGDSLVQALDKLLNNALEHGHPDHPIHVTLENRVRSCSISISDLGDPLPPSTTNIFEPFVTLKTTQPGSANLGLGLFVAKTIVVNHGGTLHAEALTDPDGARFVVELPHARAESAEDTW
jgi:signal transduction histidine kinase